MLLSSDSVVHYENVNVIWQGVENIIGKALDGVLIILPQSPFRIFIDKLEKYDWLNTLNWIVPIGNFIAIGEAWLVAITIFYAYSAVLRWIKAIE